MKKLALIICIAFCFCIESFANSIEIECNEPTTCGDDYECNIEKCLIKNAKNLKEALLYDIKREVEKNREDSIGISMAYEAMLQLDLFNGQKDYDVSVKIDHNSDECRRSGDCIESYNLTIEKMNENAIKLIYVIFSIYEKTYRKTKDGIEVITENYI